MTPEQAASIITTLTQQLAQAEAALDEGREAMRAANEQVRRADDEVARAKHFIERNRVRAEKAERALAVVATDRGLLLVRAEKAEAALDRMRALCDETDRNAVVVEHAGDVDVIITRAGFSREVSTAAVRAAIEGES